MDAFWKFACFGLSRLNREGIKYAFSREGAAEVGRRGGERAEGERGGLRGDTGLDRGVDGLAWEYDRPRDLGDTTSDDPMEKCLRM